jgi:hypothetical protein
MSENKEKDKENRDLPVAEKKSGEMFNDISELLSWMQSPRIHWDNFAVTLPVENPNDIKWISNSIGEA